MTNADDFSIMGMVMHSLGKFGGHKDSVAEGMRCMENDAIISLRNIGVSFDGESVLEDFNLNIRDGEFVTLLGPSGCGKTTTLRIIGGFVNPDRGDIFFNGKECLGEGHNL